MFLNGLREVSLCNYYFVGWKSKYNYTSQNVSINLISFTIFRPYERRALTTNKIIKAVKE